MRKQWITTFTLLSVVLASSGLAVAGGHGHAGGQKFMKFFDTNQDGTVTQEEFSIAAASRFTKMDSDKNGVVSADEFRSYVRTRRSEHRQQRYQDMDANKDGQISKDEFLLSKRQRAEGKFARMDKNGDGLVSAEEHASCRFNKRGHFGGRRIFQRLDANNDGSVTKAEGTSAWSNWFKRLDSNDDQVVTTEEVGQARAR